MVVGVVYFVGITMGKLALDPIFVVHAAVQFGAQQVLEAMIGLASFIAHEAKRFIGGVFTRGALRVVTSKN